MAYTPSRMPEHFPPEVRAWLAEELQKIAEAFLEQELVNLVQLNVAPTKYQDGDIVYADGTNWNPGSGEGIYARYNSAWNKL